MAASAAPITDFEDRGAHRDSTTPTYDDTRICTVGQAIEQICSNSQYDYLSGCQPEDQLTVNGSGYEMKASLKLTTSPSGACIS